MAEDFVPILGTSVPNLGTFSRLPLFKSFTLLWFHTDMAF